MGGNGVWEMLVFGVILDSEIQQTEVFVLRNLHTCILQQKGEAAEGLCFALLLLLSGNETTTKKKLKRKKKKKRKENPVDQ